MPDIRIFIWRGIPPRASSWDWGLGTRARPVKRLIGWRKEEGTRVVSNCTKGGRAAGQNLVYTYPFACLSLMVRGSRHLAGGRCAQDEE